MLTVHNLHKSYQVGKTTYEVLKGVSLEVGKGEFVAVIASWPSWMKPPWPLFETNSLGLSFRIFCC